MTKLRNEQCGFVLSGIALLLILPAMLLAVSSLKIIEIGGESTSIQALSDKVDYTGRNVTNTIKFMQTNKIPINESVLKSLAENYSSATGLLVDVTIEWIYPLWIHVQDTGINHYAGTRYCSIEEIYSEGWNYSFEDLDLNFGQNVDFDYDEPSLLVEKKDGKLNITIAAHESSYHSDVYYSSALLWLGVGGNEGNHIGENVEIEENLFNLFRTIGIDIRDPRNLARYVENIVLI